MSKTTTNLGLVKPERSDNYNVDVMAGNMDIIDERITAVENGDITLSSKRLSYSGFFNYKAGVIANDAWYDVYIPIFNSFSPISGVVSLKYSGSAYNPKLRTIGPNGITETPFTTTQTEYTVTNAYSIFVTIGTHSSSVNTVTIGCPILLDE